jgi:hypothetical protein
MSFVGEVVFLRVLDVHPDAATTKIKIDRIPKTSIPDFLYESLSFLGSINSNQ